MDKAAKVSLPPSTLSLKAVAAAAPADPNLRIESIECLNELLLTWCLQNAISHRGKALAKLKAWLAGGDFEP